MRVLTFDIEEWFHILEHIEKRPRLRHGPIMKAVFSMALNLSYKY